VILAVHLTSGIPVNFDGSDEMNMPFDEQNNDESQLFKRKLPMEGILIGRRALFPHEGILIGRRNIPNGGIILGKREYPTEGILLGKRDYSVKGILLGKREYPTEGILLGKRNNFRF
jgi:hypothetical protein